MNLTPSSPVMIGSGTPNSPGSPHSSVGPGISPGLSPSKMTPMGTPPHQSNLKRTITLRELQKDKKRYVTFLEISRDYCGYCDYCVNGSLTLL